VTVAWPEREVLVMVEMEVEVVLVKVELMLAPSKEPKLRRI